MSHNQAFFDPASITVMTTTFEATLCTLGLVDHTGLAAEMVAKKIIEQITNLKLSGPRGALQCAG
jgi:hypothetical protein